MHPTLHRPLGLSCSPLLSSALSKWTLVFFVAVIWINLHFGNLFMRSCYGHQKKAVLNFWFVFLPWLIVFPGCFQSSDKDSSSSTPRVHFGVLFCPLFWREVRKSFVSQSRLLHFMLHPFIGHSRSPSSIHFSSIPTSFTFPPLLCHLCILGEPCNVWNRHFRQLFGSSELMFLGDTFSNENYIIEKRQDHCSQ